MNRTTIKGTTARSPLPRLTPLATCLAAALAFSASSPLLAGDASREPQGFVTRAQLVNSVPSGEAILASMTEAQAASAERSMRRMLGLDTFGTVTGATIPVSNCNDSGAGSLRAAVGFASSGDTIDMSSQACIVNLTSSIVTSLADLTIVGNPNTKYPMIDGQDTVRPFYHTGGGTLTLSGVSVRNGRRTVASGPADAVGGCIRSNGSITLEDSSQVKYCKATQAGSGNAKGGAIFSSGSTLVLSNSSVTGGEAIAATGNSFGGGIYAIGGVQMKYGTVSNSSATSSSGFTRGGGIYSGENLTSKSSTIRGNVASGANSTIDAGGGAWIDGTSLILRSTISGNGADTAAALVLGRAGTGTSTISESTIADNAATASLDKYGGGMYLGNASTIRNCTISGNTEKNAGNKKYGAGFKIKNGVSVTMSSTIVSGNSLLPSGGGTLPSDIRGTDGTPATVAGDHNLVGFSTFASTPADTIVNLSPQLGPLANNGGVTRTKAVLPGSPAINKGFANGFTTDQRGTGFIRTFGPAPDIGAFEVGGDSIFFNGFD